MESPPAKRDYNVFRHSVLDSTSITGHRPLCENEADRTVCYGSLHDAVAMPSNPNCLRLCAASYSEGRFTRFSLRERKNNYFLLSKTESELAVLDTRTAAKLVALKRTQGVEIEALVDSGLLSKRRSECKERLQSFPVSINILGPKSIADDVAALLADVSGYLQHPKTLYVAVEYHNPQFLIFPDDVINMNDLIGIGDDSTMARKIKISQKIADILDSLTEVSAGNTIELPPGLISELKKHQKDGLRFILQREEEKFSKELSVPLLCAISSNSSVPVSTSFGGLIADAMGLGKTLTMLVSILHSLPTADVFGDVFQNSGDGHRNIRTKATLVVVPSAQLLKGWISEIDTHFLPGSLRAIWFHGQDRPQDPEVLRFTDIVLTTYATLASDYSRKGLLYQMQWFRVVLDEAHWIRNSSCKLSSAAWNLHARSRWCLTGTPIQNKLDDLASLAQFLRLPPVSTRQAFQKQVLIPLFGGGSEFAKPLQSYLKAHCLRRTETYLNLPPSSEKKLILDFSLGERSVYTRILDKTKREIDRLVSGVDSSKYNRLFAAILKMRMCCNRGTFSPVEDNLETSETKRLEMECESCPVLDEDNLNSLNGDLVCPECGRQLKPHSKSSQNQTIEADDRVDDTVAAPKEGSGDQESEDILSPGTECSTKLFAVVENIANSGRGAKSIVFSCWTSTLDLISQLLTQAHIEYVQVDGRVSHTERLMRLERFRENREAIVLLMSFGTGAVGLNLTAANYVHIVEPQWNPSVEEQAIARALRMGQTRSVMIFRYMMKNTVEQNILDLQLRKKQLARFTFDSEVGERLSDKLKDLRLILDMELTQRKVGII